MGKIVFWIVVFFLILLALRLLSVHQTRKEQRRDKTPAQTDKTPVDESMVKCQRCGVFLPKSTSVMSALGPVCRDDSCDNRR